MASAALMDAGLPVELAEKVLCERAAITIQRFVRRSVWRVKVTTDEEEEHLFKRYKPLGFALKRMMHAIVREKRRCFEATRHARKLQEKRPHRRLHQRTYFPFRVALMRRNKLFGDLEVCWVDEKSRRIGY